MVVQDQTHQIMWKLLNNQRVQLPWLTLSTGALALFFFALPSNMVDMIQFNRTTFADGAWWQLFTGHLTHWNLEHLIMDLAVFVGIGYQVEKRSKKSWIFLNLASAIAISLSVFVFRPNIELYRGLSGVDMALAGFWITDALMTSIREKNIQSQWIWVIGLLGLILKPCLEIYLGHPIFVQDLGSNVVGMPIPHVIGAIMGIGLIAMTYTSTRRDVLA